MLHLDRVQLLDCGTARPSGVRMYVGLPLDDSTFHNAEAEVYDLTGDADPPVHAAAAVDGQTHAVHGKAA